MSNCGIFSSRLLLLLLEVCGPFDARLPALGFALGLGELDHEKRQDNHCSQECEDGDGLAHFLVVATRHYPWRCGRMQKSLIHNKLYLRYCSNLFNLNTLLYRFNKVLKQSYPLLCNVKHTEIHRSKNTENRFLKVITFCLVTSRDVPGPTLPRRQRPDLGTVRPQVRQGHFVQVHWEKLLVLPKVAKSIRGRQRQRNKL